MAKIDSDVLVYPNTATRTDREIERLQSGTIDLGQHAFTANLADNSDVNDNDTDGFDTIITAGNKLVLRPGVQASGGSIKITASPDRDTDGGMLELFNASLTCGKLVTSGNTAGTTALNLNYTNNESDSDFYPTLYMHDGSQLVMTGGVDAAYRIFLGNANKGRVIARDSSISFGDADASGFQSTGSNRGSMFLGTNSQYDNVIIQSPLKTELSGKIDMFKDVTIRYANHNDIREDGVLYLANEDIDATLGAHEFDLPFNKAFAYNTTGTQPYAAFRADACKLTLNGPVKMNLLDTEIGLINLHFSYQDSQFSGMNNQLQLNSQLTTEVRVFDTDNEQETFNGSAASKYGFMDNRDFLVIDKTNADFRNDGVLTDTEYTYYYFSKHAVSRDKTDGRNMLGWPTGKAAAAPGFTDGSAYSPTLTSFSSVAPAFNAYYNGDSGDIVNTAFNGVARGPNDRLNRDMRRFYPMRSGYFEWGRFPEWEKDSLGTENFPVANEGNMSVGNWRAAEASNAPLINGTTVVINAIEDVVAGLVTPAAASALPIEVVDPTGPNGLLHLNQSGLGVNTNTNLDAVYQRGMGWVYDHMNDATATWNARELTGSLRDDLLDIDTDTTFDQPSVGRYMGFFEVANPGGTTPVAGGGTEWDKLQSFAVDSDTAFLRYNTAQDAANEEEWTNGHIYFWIDANNWGFFEFERSAEEGLPGLTGARRDFARITHIASAGTIHHGPVALQRGILRDSLDIEESYPVRSYLWQPDIQLRPLFADGNTMRTRRVSINQPTAGNGYFRKGDHITGIDLSNADDVFNANKRPIAVDISGAGQINRLMPSTDVSNPSVQAGSTITSRVVVDRDSEYLVAGDMSQATFVLNGADGGAATVNVVGNGRLPSVAPNGIRFRRSVEVSFVAPGTNTWRSTTLDSEYYVNIAAVAAPAGHQPAVPGITHQPFSTTPVGSIGRDDVDFTTSGQGWRLTTATSASAAPTFVAPGPLPANWTDLLTNNGGINVNLVGHHIDHVSALETAIDSDGKDVQVVMFRDEDNWAVFNVAGGHTSTGTSLSTTLTSLFESEGNPDTELNIFYNVDTEGNIVPIYDQIVRHQARTLSADNRTLTYTFELDNNHELRYAFSSKNGTEEWAYIATNVVPNFTNSVSTVLQSIPSGFVPHNISSNDGMAEQAVWMEANPVVGELVDQIADTEANAMQVTVFSAFTNGSVADGAWMMRRMQSKYNYLLNVARGNFANEVIRYNQGYVIDLAVEYGPAAIFGDHMIWQKNIPSSHRVSFDTSMVSYGQSYNYDITTDNLLTEVRFNGQENLGILNQAQADLLEDTAKRSDVYGAAVAL